MKGCVLLRVLYFTTSEISAHYTYILISSTYTYIHVYFSPFLNNVVVNYSSKIY
jgi:hypothetical protein